MGRVNLVRGLVFFFCTVRLGLIFVAMCCEYPQYSGCNLCCAVVSFLSIISGFLSRGSEDTVKPSGFGFAKQQLLKLHGSAVFALFWSFGSLTNTVSRQKFTSLYWQLMHDDVDEKVQTFESLPAGCCVYDWTFDTASCTWRQWSRDLPSTTISPSADVASIIVPTVEGVRHQYILKALLLARAHVMFVGGTGTGKTVVVTHTLMEGLPENWHNHMMSLSARSSANAVQDSIDNCFEKRRKGVYGPPLGHHLAVFVDDMNMPVRETYGASPCSEILRQLIGQGGWYERQELHFRWFLF